MATKTIAWGEGDGSITLTYDGSGNGAITVTSSDNNLFKQRSQTVTVQTTTGSPQQTKTVTIVQAARQQIDLSTAVVTAATQTYSGSALTPAPTVTLNGETVPSTGYDVTYSNNTNAGTATVTITGKGDYTGTASGNFTINKANPTYTAPAANPWTYNGTSYYLVTAGSTSHGTIYYSSNGSSWSTERPSKTDAGIYTTYWKLTGDSNHNDVASTSISTTVSKANGVAGVSARSLTYSGSAQNLVTVSGNTGTVHYRLGTSGSWTTTIPTSTNANDYTVYYYVDSSTNYNAVGSSSSPYSVTATIAKATPTYTAPVASSNLKYTGSAQYLTTTGSTSHGTIYYSSDGSTWYTTRRTGTAVNTYTTYWKLTGDSNHSDVASTSITTTIAKGTGSVTTAPTAKNISYTGSAQTVANAGSGTGTMYYRLGTSGSYSTTVPKATNPGDYTLYYYAAASTNYEQSSTGSIGITMKESYSTTYGYVSDGLVFALDGVSKGHDSTKWLDLVGGLEFPFASCATKGTNKVSFDGSGYMRCATTKSFPQSSYTIEYVIYHNPDLGDEGVVFEGAVTDNVMAAVQPYYCIFNKNLKKYRKYGTDNMYSGNADRAMINGREVFSNFNTSWAHGNGYMYVGGYSGSSTYHFNGDIYAIRVYNRKLTHAEMLQNQKIDNTRFGFGHHMDETYVDSGLIFQLDGIDKGTDSNNWTDLVTGLKFPYGSNATKGTNYVQFNGSGPLLATSSIDMAQENCTIEVCIDPITTNSIILYPAKQGDILFALYSSNPILAYYGSNSATRFKIPYTSYRQIDIRNGACYANGSYQESSGIGDWSYGINGQLKIGGRGDYYNYSGKIYAIRVYNKKLEASAIRQNQRLDNYRFGINGTWFEDMRN